MAKQKEDVFAGMETFGGSGGVVSWKSNTPVGTTVGGTFLEYVKGKYGFDLSMADGDTGEALRVFMPGHLKKLCKEAKLKKGDRIVIRLDRFGEIAKGKWKGNSSALFTLGVKRGR